MNVAVIPLRSLKLLRFICNDAFTIQMRGLVLRGNVVQGSIQTGQRLTIPTLNGSVEVAVGALELNRRIVDFVDTDDDIGIIVEKSDDLRWVEIFRRINQPNLDEPEIPPYNVREFGISLPCEIIGSTDLPSKQNAG